MRTDAVAPLPLTLNVHYRRIKAVWRVELVLKRAGREQAWVLAPGFFRRKSAIRWAEQAYDNLNLFMAAGKTPAEMTVPIELEQSRN